MAVILNVYFNGMGSAAAAEADAAATARTQEALH